MSGGAGSTGARVASTPWPILAAVGLATGEVGIFAGSVPVATAGLILLGGGLAGILADAGYVGSPARSMVPVGGLFVLVGGGLWSLGRTVIGPGALTAITRIDGIAPRAVSLVVAGGLLLALGTVAARRSVDDR